MRKGLLTLVFAIAVISGVFLFTRANRDERRIRKNLDTVAGLLEKEGNETIVVALARIRKITSFFLKDCHIEVGNPVPVINGRDELISTVSHAHRSVGSIKVKLSDISITLEEDLMRAESTLTAAASVSNSVMEKDKIYPRELVITWQKAGREWKIENIRAVETFH